MFVNSCILGGLQLTPPSRLSGKQADANLVKKTNRFLRSPNFQYCVLNSPSPDTTLNLSRVKRILQKGRIKGWGSWAAVGAATYKRS